MFWFLNFINKDEHVETILLFPNFLLINKLGGNPSAGSPTDTL
jgi:hypothetical protein